MAFTSNSWLWSLFFFCLLSYLSANQGFATGTAGHRTFIIDYQADQFMMDGQPFRYISGSMHYFRVPRIYWKDRFLKMKAAGLNAVQTYIEWGQHEHLPGEYTFNDNLDFVNFTLEAAESGLLVILRAGPYICAARDMGGFPFWLLRENPNMQLRTSDPAFLYWVDKWLAVLLPMIRPLLYENGGPVIAIQVENEYGSYPACDSAYMLHLRDVFRAYLGTNVVLFTTDGSADYFLRCGKTEGLYATIDFGPGVNVTAAFGSQRDYEPNGPLVNSEFYPGWDDNWGYPHEHVPVESITTSLEEILQMNASVNMYMFTGGTSFGFTNGAVNTGTYNPYITSYDYGAPISEAGDLTSKYWSIRTVIQRYQKQGLPALTNQVPPSDTPKYAYGNITMTMVGNFFDILPYIYSGQAINFSRPLTFEEINQAYGFVLYETEIHERFMQPSYLRVSGLRDRGYVFLNQKLAAVLCRIQNITQTAIMVNPDTKLSILVENQGRLDYGSGNNDVKGIIGSVTVNGKILQNWTMIPMPFNKTEVNEILKLQENHANKVSTGSSCLVGTCQPEFPAFFTGTFTVPDKSDQPMDTFLHLPGWHKGTAFLNGFNLGRYWPIIGPQNTLFVPKNLLNKYPAVNSLILFELENSPCKSNSSCSVIFIDHPIIDGPTPYGMQPSSRQKKTLMNHTTSDTKISVT